MVGDVVEKDMEVCVSIWMRNVEDGGKNGDFDEEVVDNDESEDRVDDRFDCSVGVEWLD